jgi:hypothetical protein
MESLIGLLITLVILGLIFYVVYWAIGHIPMVEPIKTVVMVIFALIVVVVLLSLLFGGISIPLLRVR